MRPSLRDRSCPSRWEVLLLPRALPLLGSLLLLDPLLLLLLLQPLLLERQQQAEARARLEV